MPETAQIFYVKVLLYFVYSGIWKLKSNHPSKNTTFKNNCIFDVKASALHDLAQSISEGDT